MKVIFNLFRLLIYSNLYISLAAVSFFYAGYLLLTHATKPPPFYYLSFVFLSTFNIYNLHIILSKGRKEALAISARQRWAKKNHTFIFYSFYIALLLLLFNLLWLKWKDIFFLAHLGAISIAYNLPYHATDASYRSIRTIPLIKIFLIAYVWAALGTLFPALVLSINLLSNGVLLLFVAHFLFIIAITLPFDIRDFYVDKKNKLLTFPGFLGIKFTKVLAILCLFFFTSILFLFEKLFLLPVAITNITAGWLIITTDKDKNDFYYLGLVDGTIIFYFILIFMFIFKS